MSNDNHVKTFIGQIQDEHQKAVEKHPFFAHGMFNATYDGEVKELLEMCRSSLKWQVENDCVDAYTLLDAEIWEAVGSWFKGDYDHCLQELAQCGAVILRMMQMVLKKKQEVRQ